MTIDGVNMTDFWDHVLQVRDPAWHPPTNDQTEHLAIEAISLASTRSGSAVPRAAGCRAARAGPT